MTESFGELNNCVLLALDLDCNINMRWMPESGSPGSMVAQEGPKAFFYYYSLAAINNFYYIILLNFKSLQ